MYYHNKTIYFAMNLKNIRILVLVSCLVTVLACGAQTPEKPRVQTSAAPEETAVWKPAAGEAPAAAATSTPQVARKRQKSDAGDTRQEADGMKTEQMPTAQRKDNKKPVRQKPSSRKPAGQETSAARQDVRQQAVPARYHALKTNVAFDAIGVLNLAYEVQLHRKMTLDLPVMWSLWDAQREHALRVIALQPELRWWTGSEVGRGHFLGLHAHAAWFNFKWEDNRYQDAGRPLLGAGLSYGYKLPLGQHWGAEFNVGVGYANLKYNTYYNIENSALINTRIRHYWGLTRLGLSLVYRL